MNTQTPLYAFSLGADLTPGAPFTVQCGSGPISIVYGFGSIWVACTDTGNVERFDLAGNKIATVSFGANHSPQGMCVAAGSVWVTDLTANILSRIDPLTNAVIATVSVGLRPSDCCFDGTYIWTANFNGASISKVDPATNTVVDWLRPVTTPSYRMCFDGKRLWVGDWTGGVVVGIDVATGSATTITGISQPWGMFFDGSYLWVSSYGASALYVIDTHTLGVAYSVPLATNAGPHDVIGIDREIWVANSNLNNIQCFDKLSRSLIRTLPTGVDPAGLCFDGSSVWVTNALGHSFMRFQVKETW